LVDQSRNLGFEMNSQLRALKIYDKSIDIEEGGYPHRRVKSIL
jgi:hypothetical protein